MEKMNATIMQEARKCLSCKWGLAILTYLIAAVIMSIGGAISVRWLGILVIILISGPMSFGVALFSLKLARGQKAEFEQVFAGFKVRIERSILVFVLVTVFVSLWTLLLIVPGIIASLAYSQVFFILNEDKKIDAMDAIAKSKQMMYGYKWKFFCLNVRFIGWMLLSILTLGIGFLWLNPYMRVSYARFYEELKQVQDKK